MTRFFYLYVSWLVRVAVRASGNKVAAGNVAVKGDASGIGQTIFPVINKTIDNNRKNCGNNQIHYYVMSEIGNNTLKIERQTETDFENKEQRII